MSDTDVGKTRWTPVSNRCLFFFFLRFFDMVPTRHVDEEEGGRERELRDLRASALKNATLSYFTIPKSYFINYTIPFYNTPYIQKLYYFTFSLKYYFF